MATNEDVKKKDYFANRNVDAAAYSGYTLPKYLRPYFREEDKGLAVLDIGCGLGQFLNHLKGKGFTDLVGVDINEESIAACRANGLSVEEISDIREFAKKTDRKFDRIVMSHVLEHIDKESIIDTLAHIKRYLLKEGGLFLLMVPNAQSPTGSYWRYEDFTHTILFTAGSCQYVLKAAGFNTIVFIDPDGTQHMSPVKRVVIKSLMSWYRFKENIKFKVLQTAYHQPSPKIYTFELKVAAG